MEKSLWDMPTGIGGRPVSDPARYFVTEINWHLGYMNMSVKDFCKYLDISTSTYYRLIKHPENFTIEQYLKMRKLFRWEKGILV